MWETRFILDVWKWTQCGVSKLGMVGQSKGGGVSWRGSVVV